MRVPWDQQGFTNHMGVTLTNTSKLTEIDKRIKRDTKKLEEVEKDPTDTHEQWQL